MRGNDLSARFVVASFCLFTSLVGNQDARGDVIYQRVNAGPISGSWTTNPDETFAMVRGFEFLDLNRDQSFEFELGHGFKRPALHVPSAAAKLAETAATGMAEIALRLYDIRQWALAAANAGVNDEDLFASNQRAVDHQLDWVSRIANNWRFEGQPLLNGSLGRSGTSHDSNLLTVDRATGKTAPLTHLVTVTQPAARATTVADFSQIEPLRDDETLTINGVNIDLYAGSTQDEVILRINDFSHLTGVEAKISGSATQLYSTVFGSLAEISSISNARSPSSTTTGFSNVPMATAVGADWIVEVDGAHHRGNGRTVTINRGVAEGLTLTAEPDPRNGTTSHPTGSETKVTVYDNSISYLLLPSRDGNSVSHTFPSLQSSSLGIGVANNQFSSLAMINLSNADKAVDALQIVDAAIDEVNSEQRALAQLLRTSYLPNGFSEFRPLGAASLVANEGQLAVLTEGELVSSDRVFSESLMTFDANLVDEEKEVSKFFGFRFWQGDQSHYGWMRVSLDVDNRPNLIDFAYESRPGRSLRVGFVPEPGSGVLVGLAICALMTIGRRSAVASHAGPRKSSVG